MDDFPNLEALGRGCVSGRISEWPLLKVEARAALDRIARLEAVVRAGDGMRHAIIGGAGGLKRIQTAHAYDAARSRVNLPPAHVDDGYSQTDKCGPDCTLEVLRPGVVQCNGDGLKCPNKEASDGLQAKQS